MSYFLSRGGGSEGRGVREGGGGEGGGGPHSISQQVVKVNRLKNVFSRPYFISNED